MGTFLFSLTILVFANRVTCETSQNDRLLLVISLDGFRYDYLDLYANKDGFLHKMAAQGVRASWSESIFPTQTYPNHWSIVTGLYPEVNGILNNDVYDPKHNKYFKYDVDREDEPGWFETYEPIWITNKKSILKRKHSVVIDWPGNSASFGEKDNENERYFRHPSSKFFNVTTFNQTVDLFVQSLSHEKTNLAFLYFGEPDLSGHMYGPDSSQVAMVVRQIDVVLAYLFDELKLKKKFILNSSEPSDDYRSIDLVILTDHGMTNIQAHQDSLG